MTLCIQASMCRGVSLSTKVHVSVSVWVHVPESICILVHDHLYVWQWWAPLLKKLTIISPLVTGL